MPAPIRPEVHALTTVEKPLNELTLRDALEWFKKAVRAMDGIELRGLESKELNGRWAHICNVIAEREGVPTGSLSYYLGELAQAEINLAETAELEAQAATMYNPS